MTLSGELGIKEISSAASDPGGCLPVVSEGDELSVLADLGQVGVGIRPKVGADVLGEEGAHALGR